MKPSVRIVIFAAASLWPVATSAQQLSARVGSLSPQRAFAESAEGKAGSSVLSADARARQTREVERFRVDVQRFIEQAQAELVGAQREIESAFLARLRPAVEQVAKAKQLQHLAAIEPPRK